MNLDASLEMILQSEDQFGELFYDVLFKQCPEARQYFDETDMKRQSLMLTMSLKLMGEYHANGYSAIRHYLEHLGTRHSDRGVPRELYNSWIDALIVALTQFHGDDWNDALALEWRKALSAVTDVMFDGYHRRVRI